MSAKRDRNKVRAIAKKYVRNGFNLSQAVKEQYPIREGVSLAVQTHRIRYSQEFIEEAKREIAKFDKSLVSPDYVILKLYELIEDNTIKASDKVNALGLVAKILQMTKEQGNTNNLAIFGDVLGELRAVSVKSMPLAVEKVVTNTPITDVSSSNT